MKALLSANLAEGKIRIVDNEALDEAKTKILNKIIVKYGENIRIIIVSSYTPDQKLLLASQNLKNLSISKPNVNKHLLFIIFKLYIHSKILI